MYSRFDTALWALNNSSNVKTDSQKLAALEALFSDTTYYIESGIDQDDVDNCQKLLPDIMSSIRILKENSVEGSSRRGKKREFNQIREEVIQRNKKEGETKGAVEQFKQQKNADPNEKQRASLPSLRAKPIGYNPARCERWYPEREYQESNEFSLIKEINKDNFRTVKNAFTVFECSYNNLKQQQRKLDNIKACFNAFKVFSQIATFDLDYQKQTKNSDACETISKNVISLLDLFGDHGFDSGDDCSMAAENFNAFARSEGTKIKKQIEEIKQAVLSIESNLSLAVSSASSWFSKFRFSSQTTAKESVKEEQSSCVIS